MNILITGIHGFVGQNLMPYLEAKGHTIYGLGRTGDYVWDDLESDRIPHVDAIIHLAGKAHDTKNQTEADVYFKVNRDLTMKVFSYFLNHQDIKKFIFFSSVKAAADQVVGEILTEDVTPTPKGPYGESKAEAEKQLNDVWKQALSTQTDGRQLYILRPCMMHGPGNKGNLNLLFCSIQNVCFVVKQLLEQPVESGIYNLADDEALSTNTLVEIIADCLGNKAKIWKFGRTLMTFLAKFGDRLHLPLTTERLGKLTENYIVDNSKIKRALNIDKMPLSARDGLSYTIRSFNRDK